MASSGAKAVAEPGTGKVLPIAEGIELPEDDGRPDIEIVAGEPTGAVDQIEVAIAEMPGEPRLLQMNGQLVEVIRVPPTSARALRRDVGALAIVPVSLARLVEIASEACRFYRKRRKGIQVITCPYELARMLLERGQWKRIPPITGIIECPTLRPDMSLLWRQGYDLDTGLLFDHGNTSFGALRPHAGRSPSLDPTRQEALDALAELQEGALSGFDFASDVDRAVALAMLLTAINRQAFAYAPPFGISARTYGSGKTYLAHVVNLLICGRPAPVTAPPKDPQEEQKTYAAALLRAVALFLLDNVEYQLVSDFLAAATTSEEVSLRLFGALKNVTVSTAVTFIVTGNNLTLTADLAVRFLVCRLDPKSEHPENRRFERDLMTWIPQHRGRLVAAAITFLRGFLVSGDKPDIEPWQRYPEWDRVIRSAIVWAGLPDPLLSLRTGENRDPRRLEHVELMRAWRGAFSADRPDAARPLRSVISRANELALIEDHRLKDAILAVAGERDQINIRKLGRWMAKMEGRIQSGLLIARDDMSNGSQTWKIEGRDAELDGV